jgi:hypothetical protein
VITENEKKLLKRFAIEAGFQDKAIDDLIEVLFEGIEKNETEVSLLEKFKEKLRVRGA